MDGCRDNLVRYNDFLENEKGIYLSFREGSSGISAGKDGVVISYSAVPAEEAVMVTLIWPAPPRKRGSACSSRVVWGRVLTA